MNPWFRFYAKFITDPDVEELSFEDQRHFVFVLCIKCSGLLDKDFDGDAEKRDRAIARRLGLQGEAFTFAKERLMSSRLIDENWQPRSWEKLQFKSDSDGAERMRRYRDRKKRGDNGVTSQVRTSDVLEQNRTEQNREDSSTATRSRVPSRHIDAVFSHWQKTFGHSDAKLTEKRRRLISLRLKDYSLEQLRRAIDGYKNSPFHMGQNDGHTVYDSIELILRDAQHVEKGLGFTGSNGAPVTPMRPYL